MIWLRRGVDRLFGRKRKQSSDAGLVPGLETSVQKKTGEIPDESISLPGAARPSCGSTADTTSCPSTCDSGVSELPSEKCSECDGVKDQQQEDTPSEKVEKCLREPLEGLDSGSCPPSGKDTDPLPNHSKEQPANTSSKDEPENNDDFCSSASQLLYESTSLEYTFADPVPEDFICPVCQDTLRQAVFTDCCGNRFCKSCLVNTEICQDKSCPMCRSKAFQFYPDMFTQRKINRLRVNCTNEECKWVGECEHLQRHLDQECSFTKTKDESKLIALISTGQQFTFHHMKNGYEGSDDEEVDQHRKKLKSQCEADPSAPQGDDDTSSDSDPENNELPGCIGGAEDQDISNEINPSVVSGTVYTALEQNPPEVGSGHVIRETQTGNLCLQSDSPLATQQPQGGAKPGSVSHNEPLLPDVAASQATLKFPSLFPEAEQSDSVLTPQGSILHPAGSTDLKPSDLAEQCAELPPGKRRIATEATKSQPPHTPVPTHPQSQPGSTCLNGSENGCQHSQCEAQQSTEDLPLGNKAATSNRVLPTGCNTVEAPSAPLSRAEETRPPPNVPMTESTRLCSSKHLVQNGRKPTNTNQNSTSQTTRDRKQQSASTTSLPNQSSACFNSGCGGSDDEEDDQHRKKLKSQCEADPSAPQGDDDTSSDSDPENSELPGCIGGAEDQEISNEINPSVVSGTVSTALEQNPPEDGSGHVIRETQTGNLCLQSDSPLATQLPQGGAKPGSVSHNEPLLPDVAASQATLKKFPSLCPEAEQSDSVLTPQGSILHPVGSTDLKPSDLAEQCAELPPGKRQIATEATKSQPPHTPVPTHPQSQPGSTCLNGSENGCQHSQCEAQQSTEDLPLANKAATSNRVLPTGCNTVEPPSAPLSRAEETRSPPNVPMTESTSLCSSKHLVQNGRKPTNTNQNSTSQTTRDRKQQSASTTSLPNQSSACFNSGCGGSDDEDDQHRKKLKSQCEADPSAPQGDDDTSSDSDPENSELPGCIGGAEDQEISNEINPSVVSGTVSTALEQNPPEDGSGHVIRETQTGNLCLQSDSPLATQLPQGGAKPGSVSHNEPLLPDVAASQATLKKFPSLCPEAEQSDSVLTPQGSILHPVGSTDLKPSDLAEQCAELPPGKRQIATEATKSQPPHTPVPTHPQSQPGSTCLNGSENGCQHSQCEAQQSTEDLPLANKAATSNRVLPTGCNTVEPPSAPLSRAEETRSPPNVPMTESTRLCSSKHLVQNGRKPTNTNQNSTSQTTRDRKQQSASTTSLPNQSSACFNSGCGGSDDEEDDQHRKKLKSQCEADPSAPQGDDDTSSDSDPENSELPGCIGGAEDQEISNEINPSVVSGTVSTALEQNPPEDGSGHVIRETQTGNLCLQSDSPLATQLPQGGAKPGSVSHNEPLLPDVAASQATLKKFPSLCPEAEQSDSVLTPQGSILHPVGSTDLKPSDLAEQCAELPPGKRQIATEATKSQPPHTPVPTHPQSQPGSTCLNGSENGCQHSQCEAQQSTEDLPLANKAATSNRVLPTGCNTVEPPSAPLSRAEETRSPPNVPMTESTRLCSSKHLVQNGRKPTNTNQNSTSQTTRDRKQQSASTTSLPNQSSACFNSGCGGSDDEDDQHRKKLKSQCEADPSAPQGDDDTSSDSDPENSELPGCIGGAEDQEISNEINPSVVSGTVSTALEQNPPEDGSGHVIRETQTGNLCLQSDSPLATQLPQGGAKPGSVSHNEPLLPDVAASQATLKKFPSLCPEAEQSDSVLTPQGSILHPVGSTDLKPSDLAEQCAELPPGKRQIATEATKSQPPHTPVPTHPQSQPGSTCLNGSENGCQHSQCEAQQSTEDLPLANKAATSNRVLPTGCNTVEPPSAPLSRAEETRSPPNVPMTESTRLCSSKHLVQNGRKPTNTNQNSTSQTTRDRKQQSASTTSLPNQSSACFNSGCGGSDDEDDQHRKKLKSQCEADPSAPQGDDDTSSDSDPENSELPGCIGGAEDQEISNEINPSVVSGTVSTALEQNPPEDGSGHVIRETQTGNLCLQSDSPVATQLPQGGAKPGSVSHNEPLLPDVAASQATLKKFPSLCPEAEQSDSVLTPQGSILHPAGSTDLKPSDLAEQSAELPPGKRRIATEATKSQPPHTPVPTHPQSHPGSTCLNGSENGCQHSQCEAQQSTEDLPLANKAATSNRVLPTGCNTVEAPSAPLSRAEETRPPPNVSMTESTRLCSSKHLVQNGRKPTNTNQNSTSQTTRDRKQQSASTTSLPNQSSACFNSGCGGSDDEEDDQHRKKLKSQCEADPSAPQGDDDTSSDSDPENSELPGCIGGAEDQEISNEINPSVVSGTVSTALEQNPPEVGSEHVIRETQTGNLCLQSDSPVATQLPQGGAKPGSVSHNEPLLPDVAASQAVEVLFPSLFPKGEQSDPILTPQGSTLHPAGSTDLKPSDLAEQSVPCKKLVTTHKTEATGSQPPGTPLPTHTLVPTHPQSCPFPDELALHSHKAISIDVVEEDSYISADSAHSTLPSTIKQFHDDTVESEELAKTEAHNFTSNDNTRPPSHHGGVPDAAKLPSFESNESSHIHQFTSIQGTSSTQDSQLITGVTNHTTSEESQQVPGTFLLQSPAVLSHGTGSISSPVSSNTAIEASASISLATSLPVHFSGLSDTEATWMHPGPQMPHVVSLSAVNTIPQECTNLSPNHDFQDGNSFLYLTTPFTSCHSRQTAGMSEDTAVQLPALRANLLYGCQWAVEIHSHSQDPPYNGCRLSIFVAVCARRGQALKLLELMTTLVQSRIICGMHGTSFAAVFDGLWIDSESDSIIVDESCCSVHQSSESFLFTLRQMIALFRKVWSLFHGGHGESCGGIQVIDSCIAALNGCHSSGEAVDEFLLRLFQTCIRHGLVPTLME